MAAKKGGKGSGTRKVGKSAITGKFVSAKEVKLHPRTTFKETVRTGKRGKK
jgi:hypothetical protein